MQPPMIVEAHPVDHLVYRRPTSCESHAVQARHFCVSSYKERAKAVRSDGSVRFPLPGRSVDRVVSTYVLDLLSETDIREAIRAQNEKDKRERSV